MGTFSLFIAVITAAIFVANSARADEIVDANGLTQRNNMHSCPVGLAVTGLDVAQNSLLCDNAVAIHFTQETVDPSTQAFGLHACPTGSVMTGVRADQNLFDCTPSTVQLETPVEDTSTVRAGMHACPVGSVLVGLNVASNILLCATPESDANFSAILGVWSCTAGSCGAGTWTFDSDLTFQNSLGNGAWTLAGATLAITYASGYPNSCAIASPTQLNCSYNGGWFTLNR